MERHEIKELLDDHLNKLMIAVAEQLAIQVKNGENLRAAIDFLRLNKRSVPEYDVVKGAKDPSDYLNGLIETIGKASGRNRQ